MDFLLSKSEPSLPEDEKVQHEKGERITSQLYLRTSPSQNGNSQALNKDVILRRIRHHKCLNKIRSAFQPVFSTSHTTAEADLISAEEWLVTGDVFSSP